MNAKIRLYVDHPLGPGQSLTLDKAQAHYLFGVMRLNVGAAVLVFNGRDGEWRADVVEAGKRGGVLACIEQTKPLQLPPDLWLLFAPIKKARTDFIVEKAAQHIQLGDASIVAAGGQENMTLSPHAQNLRAGQKMGDLQFIDTMIRDGLWDAFNGYHMGQTAENVAQKWQISRDQQDEFAVASQNKAEAAQKAGRFADEIAAFTIKTRKGDTIVDQDEYIRHGATMEAMQKLRPAFTKDGSVTAANASGLNDGAAAALLMSADEAEKRGITPLARIASYATAGLDPSIMGVGPIYASRKALEKAGWKAEDLDLVEANEAFAAQACAVNKDMGWDPAIVNVNGGAIAIGHPIGASGARILNTLLFEMQRRGAKKGLATLCIGGGMGVAMCLERP